MRGSTVLVCAEQVMANAIIDAAQMPRISFVVISRSRFCVADFVLHACTIALRYAFELLRI